MQVWSITSAVSRAILKPVYRFGIPNSDPQTLKSFDFWCKVSSSFVVAEPREQCLDLFRMQNSQNFLGLCPWTPLGRDCNVPQTPKLYNRFSPHYAGRKTGTPKKLLDTALTGIRYLKNSLKDSKILKKWNTQGFSSSSNFKRFLMEIF